MAKTKRAVKIVVNGLNLTPVFRNASVSIDRGLREHLAQTRKALDQLERVQKAFDDAVKDLEAQDKLRGFNIQTIISEFNQMDTLASNVRRKVNETISCVIHKIG
jgi:hypothetical protein